MGFQGLLAGRGAQQDIDAFSRSQAIIWFAPDGTILDANDNFCRCLGYDQEQVRGKHHSIFVDSATRLSADYKAFWARLGSGEFDRGEYKRIRKDGSEIWISASYNPVIRNGKVVRVVKIASDITALKLQADDDANKLRALRRSQAVIEFSRDGVILTANQVFWMHSATASRRSSGSTTACSANPKPWEASSTRNSGTGCAPAK